MKVTRAKTLTSYREPSSLRDRCLEDRFHQALERFIVENQLPSNRMQCALVSGNVTVSTPAI
jgi:hypothetical protein